MHLLPKCPLAISIGEEVAKGYTFIWTPALNPYFANAKDVKISCPKTRRFEADYVKGHVPHFSIKLAGAPKCTAPAGNVVDYRRGGSCFYSGKPWLQSSSNAHNSRNRKRRTNRHREHAW